MRVDLHAHFWPSAYLDLLARYRGSSVAMVRELAAGEAPAQLRERLEVMDAAGIERQVVSVTAQMPADPDPRRAVTAARLANDLCAELVGTHPDRFGAFAVVPLPHLPEAVAETDRALDELGLCGVAVTASTLGRSLADPGFDAFHANLDRRGATLFVHPAGAVRGIDPSGPDLTWLAGGPFEQTCAAVHWFLSGNARRFGRVRVVFTHLGGLLPMIWRRIEAGSPGALGALDGVWFDNLSHGHAPALRCAVDTVGAQRIVLGTDYPFLRGEDVRRCVSYVADAGLADDEVRDIVDRNAALALGW